MGDSQRTCSRPGVICVHRRRPPSWETVRRCWWTDTSSPSMPPPPCPRLPWFPTPAAPVLLCTFLPVSHKSSNSINTYNNVMQHSLGHSMGHSMGQIRNWLRYYMVLMVLDTSHQHSCQHNHNLNKQNSWSPTIVIKALTWKSQSPQFP